MRNNTAISSYEHRFAGQLADLPTDELERLAEAGHEVVAAHRVLAKTGDNIVGELLRGHETFFEWDHYPPGDVYDRASHGQYYYHAHPAAERFENENGHFHTFLRPRGMPAGITPAPVPGYKASRDPDDALSHLIAIAMNPAGLPFRLFTVNRWVTGEVWYKADDVARMLDCFEIDQAQPSWPVNRWITGMVRLFKPQILELLQARDRAVAAWSKKDGIKDVYEDRGLDVTAFMDISVEDQVRTVVRLLAERQ
ncbi:MAG TPA: hypothetical protein VGA60_01885 [Kiloniellales bacterium]|jgi:hypothetical protein